MDNKKVEKKVKNKIIINPGSPEEKIIEYVLDGELENLEEFQEDIEELIEALSYASRIKKAKIMRKYKNKIKQKRVRAMKKRATISTLKKRSRRAAINSVKKKLSKGKDLSKASASEKSRIERMVKKRKSLIDRMARKNIASQRQKEQKRLNNSAEFSKNELLETLNTLYDIIEAKD